MTAPAFTSWLWRTFNYHKTYLTLSLVLNDVGLLVRSLMKYLVTFLALAVTAVVAWIFLQNQPSGAESYFGRALLGHDIGDESAWLHIIVQGENVFFDENKDDSCNESERFHSGEPRQFTVGGRVYEITNATPGIAADAISESLPQQIHLTVDVLDERPYRMAGKMVATTTPEKCNWIQFGGKLDFLVMSQPKLRAGNETAAEVKIFIGTTTSGTADAPVPVLAKSGEKLDSFRTTIIIPREEPPYPNLDLTFTSQSGDPTNQFLQMNEFC